MFELNEVMMGRLIGRNLGTEMLEIFSTHFCGPWQCTAVWVRNCVIREISHVLIGRRPEMAMKFGFIK